MRTAHTYLYGLGGAKRSGKDTIAQIYKELHPDKDVRIIGMSDPLRDAIWIMNPIMWWDSSVQHYQTVWDMLSETRPGEDTYTLMKEIPAVREWLQKFGTEVGRDIIGENTWVNVMKQKVLAAMSDGAYAVFVTGIRYPNELQALQNLSGYSVYVERPGIDTGDTHTSENSLTRAGFNNVFNNVGDLEWLRLKVKDKF